MTHGTSKRWPVFVICSGLFLLSMLYRVSNAVIAPNLAQDLSLSPRELGLLGAVFFYLFGIAQLPLGPVLDRFGARRSMIVLNLTAVAGALVFSHSHGLNHGLIGRGLIGLGMSANLMGTNKLFTHWYRPREFATVAGLMISMGGLGSLLSTTPLVLLVQSVGWRGAFLVLAGFNLLFTLALALGVRESPPGIDPNADANHPDSAADMWHNFQSLVSSRNFWTIAVPAGLRYGVVMSIQALWAGPFLMVYLGFPEITVGNILLFMSIGYAVGGPVGGYLSDRLLKSRRKVMLPSLAGCTILVLVLAQWPSGGYAWIMAGVFFVFGLLSAWAQVMYVHIKELAHSGMSGTAMTGINFFCFMGAGVFLHGLGTVFESRGLGSGDDYYIAFMICFAALAVATVIYTFTRDTHPRD